MGLRLGIFKDLFFTYLSQIIVAICGIALIKVFTLYLSGDHLGVYLNIRRAVWILLPLITLNLSSSEAKFINQSYSRAIKYFLISILILGLFLGMVLLGAIFLKAQYSFFLFASSEYISMILPVFMFIVAYSYHLLVIGFFRGLCDFKFMNIISILFWLLAILIAIGLRQRYPDDVEFLRLYFWLYSLVIIGLETIFLILRIVSKRAGIAFSDIFSFEAGERRQFLQYGITRIPSAFLVAAIFYLPSYVATHYLSLKAAGDIGLITSILRVSQMLVAPMSLVILPRFSYLESKLSVKKLRERVKYVIYFSVLFSLLAGGIIALFSREIVQLWFGSRYLYLLPGVAITSVFIGFFLVYIILRTILDGIFIFPYSVVINFFGFLVMLMVTIAGMGVVKSWNMILFSLILGLFTLGSGSFLILVEKMRLRDVYRRLSFPLIWLIILVSIFLGIQLNFDQFSIQMIGVKLCVLVIGVLVLLFVSNRKGFDLPGFLREYAFQTDGRGEGL